MREPRSPRQAPVHRGLSRFAATMLLLAAASPPAYAQTDSLGLAGWLRRAREGSPTLRAAHAGAREASGYSDAAAAEGGPRIEAGATYLRHQDPPAADLGPLGAYAPLGENTYLFALRAIQPLYTGGRVAAAVDAAEWGERAADASLASIEVELTAAVARAYDDVLLARGLRGVAAESERALEEAARVAAENYEAGTAARLDVLRAETRLSSARAALRARETALAKARDRLAVLAGVDPASAPAVAGDLEFTEVDVDLPVLEARARGERPDVAALRAESRAAAARAAAARASRLPAISLFAAGLTSNPELVTGRDRFGVELLGGVSVAWPFFDSGRASGLAAAAQAAAERAGAEATGVVDAALLAARAGALDLETGAADVVAGRVNVERAESALEIARERYGEGVGIQLEVLDAEADLTQARVDLLRAIHAHRSALIELRRAAGLSADAPLPLARTEGRR